MFIFQHNMIKLGIMLSFQNNVPFKGAALMESFGMDAVCPMLHVDEYTQVSAQPEWTCTHKCMAIYCICFIHDSKIVWGVVLKT